MKSSTPMPTPGNSFSLVCKPQELSLYIHFPFCKRICPYCHFYVLQAPKEGQDWQEAFISNLSLDWDLHKAAAKDSVVRSIYFGGGTPSLFKSDHFKRLLDSFYEVISPSPSIEITLEANPESLSPQLLKSFKEAGINRLSLGVQSLQDQELLRLGRGHQSSKALEAISLVQEHFENYSLDLMMETPSQTLTSWEKTLDEVIKIRPPHLSLYNLVIEPGTAYARQEKRLRKQMPDLDVATQMLERACQAFESIQLARYEISAFARSGFESIHNTGYWRGRAFIGLGPSAFSFLEGKRFQKNCDLKKWVEDIQKGDPSISLMDDPDDNVRQAELLAVHLRLSNGVNLSSFTQSYGKLCPALEDEIKKLIAMGWLQQDMDILKLTSQGQLFYDRLASELMPV